MTWETAVGIIFVGIIYFYLKLTEVLNEEHDSIKVGWILSSFALVWLALSTATKFAVANSADIDILNSLRSFFNVNLWVLIFSAGYFLIYFMIKAVTILKVKFDERK